MEKIKHIVLAGIIMVSLAMFGAFYYARMDNVSGEKIASRVLADSDEDDNEEEDDEEEEESKEKTEKKSESNSAKNKLKESTRLNEKRLEKNKIEEKVKTKRDDDEDIDDEDEDMDDDEEENDKDDDEDELEDEDEEGEGTIVSKEVITNEDGTVTHRLTILKKDGRKKVIEQTFDVNNRLVSKKKSEVRSENGEEKTEVKTFDVFGEKISEYKMETKDGKKIEIKKKDVTGESKLKFNAEKNELLVKIKEGEDDGSKIFLRVRADENSTKIKLTRAGITANSNFPISVDEETGKIYIKTPRKEVELKQMPDVIVEKAKQADGLDIVKESTLQGDDRPQYVVNGIKFEKLLGFFTVEIPSEITYDANTGEKLKTEVPTFERILSWFSS